MARTDRMSDLFLDTFALQEVGSVLQRILSVVVEQTILPQFPGVGVLQNRNRSVQERDRSTARVVSGNPLDRSSNSGLLDIGKTRAGVRVHGDRIKDRFQFVPKVLHVEVVDNSLQRCPVAAEAIV